MATLQGLNTAIIQWDVARKSFETPALLARYPMGDGLIHNGVKLSIGLWLTDMLKNWLKLNRDEKALLLIEAPLVGHRFLELAKTQPDPNLEAFLASEAFQAIVPIPSKKVREKIEADRRVQVPEEALTWSGAKPSVMLKLWKMICRIANEMGRDIPLDGQPPYDPDVYEFVFQRLLKNRHFTPLHVDEIFSVAVEDEKELHHDDGIAPSQAEANKYAETIHQLYPTGAALDEVIGQWYLV